MAHQNQTADRCDGISSTAKGRNKSEVNRFNAARGLYKSGSPAGVTRDQNDAVKPASLSDFLAVFHSNPSYVDELFLQHQSPPSPAAVNVVLKVTSSKNSSLLKVCPSRKSLEMCAPDVTCRNNASSNVRAFAFDHVFIHGDPLSQVSAKSLCGVLQAVSSGLDGCVLSFGLAKTGKFKTMFDSGNTVESLGIAQLAIFRLFQFIEKEQNENQAQLSVTMTSFQLSGTQESHTDLLSSDAASQCMRLPTEVPVKNVLDAFRVLERVAASQKSQDGNDHVILSFNLYRKHRGATGAGIFSRLHLIDFGAVSGRNRSVHTPGLSGLLSITQAVLMGQRSLPYKDSLVTKVILDSIGSDACHVSIIAHINPSQNTYHDILQVVRSSLQMQGLRRRMRGPSSVCRSSSFTAAIVNRRRRRTIQMGTGSLAPIATSNFYSDPEANLSRCAQSLHPFGHRGMAYLKNCSMTSETVFSKLSYKKDHSYESLLKKNTHSYQVLGTFGDGGSVDILKEYTNSFSDQDVTISGRNRTAIRDLFPVHEQWVDGPPEFRISKDPKSHKIQRNRQQDSNNVNFSDTDAVQKGFLLPAKKLTSKKPKNRIPQAEGGEMSSELFKPDAHKYFDCQKGHKNEDCASASIDLVRNSVPLRDHRLFVPKMESVYETVMEETLEPQNMSTSTRHGSYFGGYPKNGTLHRVLKHAASEISQDDSWTTIVQSAGSRVVNCRDMPMSLTPFTGLNELQKALPGETVINSHRLSSESKLKHGNRRERIVSKSHRFDLKTKAERSMTKGFPRLGSQSIPQLGVSLQNSNVKCKDDSGLRKGRMQSPYTAVTEPRSPTTTSSGIGSEVSSAFSSSSFRGRVTSRSKSETGYSSEYESMTKDIDKGHKDSAKMFSIGRNSTESVTDQHNFSQNCLSHSKSTKSKEVLPSFTNTEAPTLHVLVSKASRQRACVSWILKALARLRVQRNHDSQ